MGRREGERWPQRKAEAAFGGPLFGPYARRVLRPAGVIGGGWVGPPAILFGFDEVDRERQIGEADAGQISPKNCGKRALSRQFDYAAHWAFATNSRVWASTSAAIERASIVTLTTMRTAFLREITKPERP